MEREEREVEKGDSRMERVSELNTDLGENRKMAYYKLRQTGRQTIVMFTRRRDR